MENRRLTAKKSSINEITTGIFVQKPGFESNYIITRMGRKLSRVRILGLVVDKFKSDDGNYAVITLDDSYDTIRVKVFINTKIFENIKKGQLVDVIGKLRKYNDEIYIMPEIIRHVDPNFETLRLLELAEIFKKQKEAIKRIEQLKSGTADAQELRRIALQFMDKETLDGILELDSLKEGKIEEKIEKKVLSKEKVLKLIKELDKGDGVDYIDLIIKSGLSENEVDQAIQELLENGTCFEPRPGKIKVL